MPSGAEMSDSDWTAFARCFGMRLAGDRIEDVDEWGRRIEGETLLVLFNAHHEDIEFCLPPTLAQQRRNCLLDTTAPDRAEEAARSPYRLVARSLAVFRTRKVDDGAERAARRRPSQRQVTR